ncbi:MAG: L-aspartate oxidase [Bacillota bacterium]
MAAGRYLVNFDTAELDQDAFPYLVIGSGVAGLFTAWAAARAGQRVAVITKSTVDDTTTAHAQGGVAAAIGAEDSPLFHLEDTLAAGAGLADAEAVQVLVDAAPARIRSLLEVGACFDRADGELDLGREGAHSRNRVVHAGGDATGAEIQRALTAWARAHPLVEIYEGHYLVDLLVRERVCYGALVYDVAGGRLRVFWAAVSVLATGGAARLFRHNTNPPVATGDGMAAAYRAGADLMDMEFVQFHPTVFRRPDGEAFLISERLRGEGALLLNGRGERFMPRYHERGELAPRDVVTRAILEEMRRDNAPSVYLDARHIPAARLHARFPTIAATLARAGFDITRELVPVTPAAHYFMGGVRTDLHGRTAVEGLYACGEAACTGVHGANRLASNSLMEGLVFAGRVVEDARDRLRGLGRPRFCCDTLLPPAGVDTAALRTALQEVMDTGAGPVRTPDGLGGVLAFCEEWRWLGRHAAATPAEMEVRNMLEVAGLVAEAALARTESRGAHFRVDFPAPRARWQKHIVFRRVNNVGAG